jgi:hypothetical protein
MSEASLSQLAKQILAAQFPEYEEGTFAAYLLHERDAKSDTHQQITPALAGSLLAILEGFDKGVERLSPREREDLKSATEALFAELQATRDAAPSTKAEINPHRTDVPYRFTEEARDNAEFRKELAPHYDADLHEDNRAQLIELAQWLEKERIPALEQVTNMLEAVCRKVGVIIHRPDLPPH